MKDINKNKDVSQKEEDRQWEKLLHWLKKGDEKVQLKALKKCISEITKDCRAESSDKFSFPDKKFTDVLIRILSTKKDNSKLIAQLHENAYHPDVVFHFWRCLPRMMLKESQTNVYHMNLLELIEKMALPKNSTDPKCIEGKALLFEKDDFQWNYDIVKKNMNKVWGRTKGWDFHTSQNVHKKHLIVMVERIMPHLINAATWTDHLMDSLNKPGSIAYLALQGVYKLMTKFNMEVSNIYAKLYNMFEPGIFHSRFKPRLFYLADLFLSSSHLPESMVASFVKRCARLTLIAPPEDILIIQTFIVDLIIRHPGLKKLVDYPSNDEDASKKMCEEDPFLENESDPSKTKAIESSLWEIRTLRRHLLPMVSIGAKFIEQNLPTVETGVGSKLEDTGSDLFNREFRRPYAEVALNFERPRSMAFPKNDKIQKYWDLKA